MSNTRWPVGRYNTNSVVPHQSTLYLPIRTQEAEAAAADRYITPSSSYCSCVRSHITRGRYPIARLAVTERESIGVLYCTVLPLRSLPANKVFFYCAFRVQHSLFPTLANLRRRLSFADDAFLPSKFADSRSP